eukprot:CAMPEP_0171106832 /NCGR_PEP_ID=MMETSP0766_2-20121228/65609_1 /TAXON_ID=439317 /ORGANISM="Gambierdiscus australes, Strain CAWD 149" /LENGTH=55 /DNA_ID=CAMNT_0011568021 /DNA_START=11 /DNA_END=174 /DNA_ORIENTATION=-
MLAKADLRVLRTAAIERQQTQVLPPPGRRTGHCVHATQEREGTMKGSRGSSPSSS